MTKFPGVLFLMRKGDPKGGTEGSTIEYIGFKVGNLSESLARWEAADIKRRGSDQDGCPGCRRRTGLV